MLPLSGFGEIQRISGSKIMNKPDYLPPSLTEQQIEAILHQGSPLLIIAGPGSGKTEVIAWRVAHLVCAGHVRPENMLVPTALWGRSSRLSSSAKRP